MAEVYEQRPRRRRGRRLLIVLVVLLLILLALAVVADRVGAAVAERVIGDRVAEQVADKGASSDAPDVTIEGVPFLTQVASGEYQEIKIELRNFSGPAGNGQTIKMPLLDVRAQDVNAPLDTLRSGNGDITAGTVTGTGTVDYATVTDLIGRDGVKLAENDGKLAVTAPVQVLQQSVTVNGTAKLTVADGNVVQVRFETLDAPGLPNIPLVQNLLNNFAKQFSFDIKVPELPLQMTVQKVQPTADGLVIAANADDVSLNTGGI
ncbi:LmeA family phospholipid-binding protein [Mangrovihabitans endophyticus]|uniref:DUF2993 domain-containing protein n=1 Tax=Mangrovihabitans endophyticus TaxID=1751298 RepID=A0A8J3FNL3_9ACTN|nr:DUF2993 domain-containing protein [Mangrovihabitans endophyticus]GGK82575.1 hypothetical protein GCM10012284_15700 [Mangrovihabitans endophyticus]